MDTTVQHTRSVVEDYANLTKHYILKYRIPDGLRMQWETHNFCSRGAEC